MPATYLNIKAKAVLGDITSSLTRTAMHEIMVPFSHWQQLSNMLYPLHLKQILQLSFIILKMLCHCGKHSRKWVTTRLKLLSQLITQWHVDSLLTHDSQSIKSHGHEAELAQMPLSPATVLFPIEKGISKPC